MKKKLVVPLIVYLVFASRLAFSFQLASDSEADTISSNFEHNSKGFEFTTPDNKYQLQIAGRLQFRFATPNDQDPTTYDDFGTDTKNTFKINRARLKVGGYAYQSWLKYDLEYELGASRLLDFRVMLEKWPWLNFQLGQWKAEYSRERSISSGKQQMMERSIINRPFTLDRQQGVSVYGHLQGPGIADFNYNLMLLTGNGLGTSDNDDENLLYAARLQWNVLGEGVEMSGSDLEYHQKPTASMAWAGASNTSQFTRFSSGGGGSLRGYEEDAPGQYKVGQWLIESAFKFRSLSWHGEFHQKNIHDKINLTNTDMIGWFGQGGYILNNNRQTEAKTLLEIALRYAHFRPNMDLPMNIEEEFSLALNCFFNEHLNKLTADVTLFEFESESLNREASGWRFRIQYDITF